MQRLNPDMITKNPELATATVGLRSGDEVVFRALRPEDGPLFGRYLAGLGEETRRCYAPHPLTMERGIELCSEINYSDTMRLILVKGQETQPEVIAYFILVIGVRGGEVKRYSGYGTPLDSEIDCTFAPCVADAYQNQGVASAAMPSIKALARRLGFRRMVLMGGTRATNARAIRFYEKSGFRTAGDFQTQGGINNHDMILQL